jgi:hypothetical protein
MDTGTYAMLGAGSGVFESGGRGNMLSACSRLSVVSSPGKFMGQSPETSAADGLLRKIGKRREIRMISQPQGTLRKTWSSND